MIGFFLDGLFGLFLQLISSKHSLNTTFMGQEVAKQKQDDTFDNAKDEQQQECDQQNVTVITPRNNNNNSVIINSDDATIRGSIPYDLFSMTHLQTLKIERSYDLRFRIDDLQNLTNLSSLTISSCKLTTLPDSIGNLTNLTYLDVRVNTLTILPDSIGNLTKLNNLAASGNKLVNLPDSIGNLTKLKKLSLYWNKLTTLPDSIGNLTNLNNLYVGRNKLTTLPNSIGNLTNLTYLDLTHHHLERLPDSIGNLTNLNNLEVNDNQLTALPDSIGNLTNLSKFEVHDNKLTILPDSIGNLTLTELNMNNNKLTSLPNGIGNLTNLTTLIVCNNQLTILPDSIGNLTKLTCLNVSCNQLTALPDSIGNLTNLNNLDTSGNPLNALPGRFTNLTNLMSTRAIPDVTTIFKITSKIDDVGVWRHVRLFLVGDSAAGKTSIVRWLKGMQFDENHNSTDSVEVSTADMNQWKDVTFDIKDYVLEVLKQGNSRKQSDDPTCVLQRPGVRSMQPKVQISTYALHTFAFKQQKSKQPTKPTLPWTFHIWDFGGQEEYYNTHHFFLNSSAIYLLVVDISQPLNLSRLQFWIDSIRYYAPTAPIIIIGTHKDKVPDSFQQQMGKIFDSFEQDVYNCSPKYCYAVSCVNDSPLHTQHVLKEVAERHKAFNTPCKLSWMLLFDELRKLKNLKTTNSNDHNNSTPYDSKLLAVMPFEKALEIATTKCGMNVGTLEENTEELKSALKFFHQLGFFIYLESNPALCKIIFVSPQQLINALRCVVTSTYPFLSKRLEPNELLLATNQGKITQATLKKLWKEYPEQFHHSLCILLQQFQLGLPDSSQHNLPESERDIIIPCLVTNILEQPLQSTITCMCEITGMPPLGFQSRVIVHMVQLAHQESSQFKFTICTTKKKETRGIEFTLYDIPVRVIVELCKVRIQVSSSEPNKIIVQIFKKVFQEINNVCIYHNNTLEQKSIEFFCSNPDCEGNTLSWEQLCLKDLHCQLCVATPNDSSTTFTSIQLKRKLITVPKVLDLLHDLRSYLDNEVYRRSWQKLATELDYEFPQIKIFVPPQRHITAQLLSF